jgi:hypothetical protein
MGFQFNGKTYDVPGVVGLLGVIQQAGANLPDFNVGLIIGKSPKGTPYNASEKGSEVMCLYDNPGAVAADYGYDDIYNNFKEAQKLGAGAIFVLNAQPTTKASTGVVNGSAAIVLDVEASLKNYGVFGNDIKLGLTEAAGGDEQTVIDSGTATAGGATSLTDSGATWTIDALIGKWVKIVSGTGIGQTRKITDNTATALTVATWTVNPSTDSGYQIVQPLFTFSFIPTKNEKMIAANAIAGQNFLWIDSIEGISVGNVFDLMTSADGKLTSVTITFINTTYNSTVGGYKVLIETAIVGATVTKANYARLIQSDTSKETTVDFTFAEWDLETIVHKLNEYQDELIFAIHTAATTTPAAFSSDYFSEIGTATLGTTPAVSSTDYLAIAGLFPDWRKDFLYEHKINIRVINLATSDTAIHSAFDALATLMKGNEYKQPLQIVAGTAAGETPAQWVTRAKNLNSDQVILPAIGFDDKPSYLSFAPQVFGAMLANPVTHNLTRDRVIASSLEGELTDTEIAYCTKNGVMLAIKGKYGIKISQGINTYQDHSHEWNEADKMTYLIQQRGLADYFHVGIMEGLDEALIGNDRVTLNDVIGFLNASASAYIEAGYVITIRFKEIKKVELGFLIKTEIVLPDVTDFIGIENYVVTGAVIA